MPRPGEVHAKLAEGGSQRPCIPKFYSRILLELRVLCETSFSSFQPSTYFLKSFPLSDATLPQYPFHITICAGTTVRRAAIFFVLVWCVLPGTLFAQRMPWAEGFSAGNDLEIQLVTIDPGDPVYSWWGHTALVVTDKKYNLSRFYNYGLFNFEQDRFFRNFAMGRLLFEVGSLPTQAALRHYRNENRSIRIQTFDMPARIKMKVALFLETNILPANRQYLYDHYYDNCATRVRDIINMATERQLIDFTDKPTEMTFRQITRRFTHRHWAMDTLIMFVMSGVIDIPMSQWQAMFLPAELERYVAELIMTDRDGTKRPFVSETSTYFESSNRNLIPDRAKSAVPRMSLVGLAIGLFIILIGVPLRQRSFRILYGTTSTIAGIGMGLPGAVILFMSLFTDHAFAYWNENLLLVNVFTALLIPLGVVAAIGKMRKALCWLWIFHLFTAVLLMLFKVFPAFSQGNWQIIALIAPISSGYAVAGYLHIIRRLRPASARRPQALDQ